MRMSSLLVSCLALAPVGALAHPHIFIDAGLTLHVDAEGHLEAVEVRWTYDPFYSLLIVEDWGLDPDRDGVLTAEEEATLAGFDLQFSEGYTGALEVVGASGAADLGAPEAPRVTLVDGQLVSSHVRPVLGLAERDVTVRTYDPTYYAAISLTLGAVMEGPGAAGCALTYAPADLGAATNLLEEMLYGPDAKDYGEDDFPAVGAAFADAVMLSCAPSG